MNETQQVECVWVPGTSDRVRLRLANHVIECRLSLVAKVFGRQFVDDLYLRGRASCSSSKQQLAMFA
ncbi:hypothetical protein DKM44_04860 [Deinococcus irradiatisoli]|uniref:Uncharacterized protein n=1 Tax=Deinococcus irradiatisoli TaxID=2202254 RepID=A0A2Z3JCG7_9DEIO|nr:hypothetical protein [Deinococcus irradiatisoli]AWN22645.1 hypothetical protein DKM44_04860 [Deinococcus irradiatisoli]